MVVGRFFSTLHSFPVPRKIIHKVTHMGVEGHNCVHLHVVCRNSAFLLLGVASPCRRITNVSSILHLVYGFDPLFYPRGSRGSTAFTVEFELVPAARERIIMRTAGGNKGVSL